jgi:Na+-transporting NADH:ubiquinone oxidoreductase subunit NqrD
MTQWLSRCIAALLICAILMPTHAEAKVRPHAAFDGLGAGSKATLIIVTLVTAAALIGVGVYFAIRQGHTLKGCTAKSANGLELLTKDGRHFVLLGATTGIAAGDQVKVTGSRKKNVAGITDSPSFVVDQLNKNYGSCAVATAHP